MANAMNCFEIIGIRLPTIRAITPRMIIYTTRMAKILGSFSFCKKPINGLSKKYKNPEIIIGKKSVEKKIPIGSNKNDILVDM